MRKIIIFMLFLLVPLLVKADSRIINYDFDILDNTAFNLDNGMIYFTNDYVATNRIFILSVQIDFTENLFHHILLWDKDNNYIGYYNSNGSKLIGSKYLGIVTNNLNFSNTNIGSIAFMINKNVGKIYSWNNIDYTINNTLLPSRNQFSFNNSNITTGSDYSYVNYSIMDSNTVSLNSYYRLLERDSVFYIFYVVNTSSDFVFNFRCIYQGKEINLPAKIYRLTATGSLVAGTTFVSNINTNNNVILVNTNNTYKLQIVFHIYSSLFRADGSKIEINNIQLEVGNKNTVFNSYNVNANNKIIPLDFPDNYLYAMQDIMKNYSLLLTKDSFNLLSVSYTDNNYTLYIKKNFDEAINSFLDKYDFNNSFSKIIISITILIAIALILFLFKMSKLIIIFSMSILFILLVYINFIPIWLLMLMGIIIFGYFLLVLKGKTE